MSYFRIALLGICFAIFGCQSTQNAAVNIQAGESNGILPDGAMWRAAVPENWNGTLLLYSRGYSAKLVAPSLAPRGSEEQLLAAGYALAASEYPETGWSVEVAIPSQLLVLEAFTNTYRKPKKVIAWGSSMGGLITAALAQRHSDKLDGAITLCASAYGAEPMMNMAFDGAYALSTLVTPEEQFSPVGRGDNFAAVKAIMVKVNEARNTPLGRARVALAGVLAGIPGWTDPDSAKPAETAYNLQEEQIAKAMPKGVFFPRGDQENRAGGIFSGNDNINYKVLLEASGRKAFVQAMYDQAGASLEDDLALLNNGQRITTDKNAVQYMRDNFTPSGKVRIPVLTAHTIGDGMTSPALQYSYTTLLKTQSGKEMTHSLWIDRAGHCTETPAERQVLLNVLETRLETGEWVSPLNLPSIAPETLSATAFVDYTPYPMPRSCSQDKRFCVADSDNKGH